jgi:hypothetical protein
MWRSPLALADGFLHDGLAPRGDYREFRRGSIAGPCPRGAARLQTRPAL